MTEVLQILVDNLFALIVILMAIGGMGGYVLDTFIKHRRLKWAHKERMAKLRAHTETAKALAAAPEEARRSELAQELLEAYGEAGEGLRNDEKGSLLRWERTKDG